MTENELRIGNIIFYKKNNEVHEVTLNTFYWISESVDELSDYEPVPLTEEWLLKFGFVKNEANWWKKQVRVVPIGDYTEFCVYEKLDAFSYQTCMWCNSHIKHVHGLQNVFHALTGQELTIKSEQ
jgi:hypothetical protein